MFLLRKGDTRPYIEQYLTQGGVAIDLTNTVVELAVFGPNGASGGFKFKGTAEIQGDATLGLVRYTWGAGEISDEAGYFEAYWLVTLGSGEPLRVPNEGYEGIHVFDHPVES